MNQRTRYIGNLQFEMVLVVASNHAFFRDHSIEVTEEGIPTLECLATVWIVTCVGIQCLISRQNGISF
jgi:hypothetical protein